MESDRHFPGISVIICAYTEARWNDLLSAIESVRLGSRQAQEIIVVIDHNPSMLARVQAEVAGVRAIANSESQGLSGARNTGIAAAAAQVIAFLDDDAVAQPDWLERLASVYASDPDVMGVGGSSEPLWTGGRPVWFPEEFDWVVGCTFRGMPEEQQQVGKLIGCNMSFRREVFLTIGGFRSEMGRVGQKPLAGEETEFCHAACKTWPHMKLIYEPAARVLHRVPLKRANLRYFMSRCYCEGLSKALITRYVGTQHALAIERAYTTRTLPAGVARYLASTFTQGSLAGLGRAGAIALGLAVTATGYAVGSTTQRLTSTTIRAERPAPITGSEGVAL